MKLADIPLDDKEQRLHTLKKVLIVQTAGIIIGTLICYFSGLGLLKELKLINGTATNWWDVLLSGIFISGGSEPIHQLINFLKGHKEQLKLENEKKAQQLKQQSTLQIAKPGSKIGITYDGGFTRKNPVMDCVKPIPNILSSTIPVLQQKPHLKKL